MTEVQKSKFAHVTWFRSDNIVCVCVFKNTWPVKSQTYKQQGFKKYILCLLYTSDAADEHRDV